MYINNTYYPNLSRGSNLDFLSEGTYRLEVKFINGYKTTSKSVAFQVDRTPPTFLFNDQETFEIPSDFPNTTLTVSLSDKNPNYMRVSVNPSSKWNYYVSEAGVMPSVTFTGLSNEAKYLSLEGIDEAGNTAVKWYLLNSSSSLNSTREMQPLLEKLNDTSLRVSIPAISPEVTGKLQISENYGNDWIDIPFTLRNTTADRDYAYYKRNSNEIIYRVAIIENGITHYIRNIKSYNWDNTIFSIKNTNITSYTADYNNYEIQLTKNQISNTSITIQWLTSSNELIQEEFFGSSLSMNERFVTRIPQNGSPAMIIRFVVKSMNQTWSNEFKVSSGFPPNEKQFVDSIVVGQLKIFDFNNVGSDFILIDTIQIVVNVNGFYYIQSISYSSVSRILFGLSAEQEIEIQFLDNVGNIIQRYSYLKILDVEMPIITAINEITLSQNESKYYLLQWKLYDIAPLKYELYIDDVYQGSVIFTVGSNVTIPLRNLSTGVHNYTLVVYDKSNNVNSHTILIYIIPDDYITVSPISSSTN